MSEPPVRAVEIPKDDARKRILTACEACRIAKTKCRPSTQPDVCQRCMMSKKECVSRTGPRTRRPKQSKSNAHEMRPFPSQPSPPKPTGTFTIDFQLPAREEVDDAFESLRDSHVGYLDAMFPEDADSSPSTFYTEPSRGHSSTPATSQGPSLDSFQARPQFNISSAETLLQAFHSMVEHYPCISLDKTATVPELARSRPFVLLAILAAASGSRTLQGHNLYDDEFRKVFGLKLVTSGETSLELLQGLLIYCAWYPFHLRPKNKQIFQYLRMATDLVQGLELDVDLRPHEESPMLDQTDEALDRIRTYLAYCYIANVSCLMFKAYRANAPRFTSWIDYCCTLLAASHNYRDQTLATLTRQSFTSKSALNAVADAAGGKQGHDNTRLVLLGLESQNDSHQASLAPHTLSSTPVKMQSLYTTICLEVGPLLRLPHQPTATPKFTITTLPKLYAALDAVRQFLSLLTSLEESVYLRFASMDWARLVVVTIVALRLSFPIPGYSQYDDAWARSQMKFGEFLDAISADSELTPVRKRVDVTSATRVVMALVRDKYKVQLEKHLAKEREKPAKVNFTCPYLDGSLEGSMSFMGVDPGLETVPLVYPDLWSAMTTEWMDSDVSDLYKFDDLK